MPEGLRQHHRVAAPFLRRWPRGASPCLQGRRRDIRHWSSLCTGRRSGGSTDCSLCQRSGGHRMCVARACSSPRETCIGDREAERRGDLVRVTVHIFKTALSPAQLLQGQRMSRPDNVTTWKRPHPHRHGEQVLTWPPLCSGSLDSGRSKSCSTATSSQGPLCPPPAALKASMSNCQLAAKGGLLASLTCLPQRAR